MQELEVKFLLGSGRLQGVWKHIAIGAREQIRIDLLSDEAMKTSAIEGEFLDRSSVQSSVMRQFGLSTGEANWVTDQNETGFRNNRQTNTRGALNWSVHHFAKVSGAAVSTMKRYELVDTIPPSRKEHLETPQSVMETAGIEFAAPENGQRGVSF